MFKVKLDELLVLIRGMTRSERTRFERDVPAKGRDAGFLALYQAIIKGRRADDQQLRALFPSTSAYLDAKKYLFKRIVASMAAETAHHDDELHALQEMLTAYVLYRKGAIAVAERYLRGTSPQAVDSTEAGARLMMATLQMRIAFVKQDLALMAEADHRIAELIGHIAAVERYRSFKLETDPRLNDRAYLKRMLPRFLADEERFSTPRDRYGYYYFMAYLYGIKLVDPERAAVFYAKGYALYQEAYRPHTRALGLQAVEMSFTILDYYLQSCRAMGRFAEMPAVFAEMQRLMRLNPQRGPLITKRWLHAAHLLAMAIPDPSAEVSELVHRPLPADLPMGRNMLDLSLRLFALCNAFLRGDHGRVVDGAHPLLQDTIPLYPGPFRDHTIAYAKALEVLALAVRGAGSLDQAPLQVFVRRQRLKRSPVIRALERIVDGCHALYADGTLATRKRLEMLRAIRVEAAALHAMPAYREFPFLDLERWLADGHLD